MNKRGEWDFSCSSYPNNPKSANHYIVIVSKKGNQYRYFEVGVGTQNESEGTDENNTFFMIDNTLESREKNNKKYRITDIRVNKIH